MARVTATEVKDILDNCTKEDTTIDVFIIGASELITKVFAEDVEIGETLLKELERWFAAHMIASTIHRTTSDEKLGDASVKYTGQWGKNLDSTPYGQMVKQLDVTGKMEAYLGKSVASIFAVTIN
jgi:hypothetical protein